MAISAQHTKFVYPDYVSPLPAEDLIKVALHKQQQFDQNVTKVQSQLDAYGQLKNNIYNEGEKAYFDETMTKLVKAVNDSAGIDFSKTANVQAVLNIGKPLEKDSIIINSVQNGKEIQRRQKFLSELDQSKRGPANDWFYMQDVNNYLKSTELGTSIAKNKEYNEFVDISDMVVDLVKNFSKEEQEEFYRQGGGMTEGYLEKITQQGFSKTQLAEKIKGMLSTNPQAARQLEIDTQYAYNNLGPQRAHQMYVEDQTLKVATLDDAISKTKEELDYYTAQNARVKSPTVQKKIQELQESVSTLTQYRTVASQNAAKTFDQFNPQDYYGTYQNNFITSLANTYSVQKISKDLKEDKVWDIVQKRNMENYKAQLDIDKERVKAGINSMTPKELLSMKKDIWEMNNVQAQDLVVVPEVLQASTFNIDIDDFRVEDMLRSNRATEVTPIEDKTVTDSFVKYLKESQPNDQFVINFKDGNTKVATKIDLLQIPVRMLSKIESIAKANTTETIIERKRQKE